MVAMISAEQHALIKSRVAEIESEIQQRARQLAESASPEASPETLQVSTLQCCRAIEEIAPGGQRTVEIRQTGFWSRMGNTVSPQMVIFVIMAAVFGLFGKFGGSGGDAAKSYLEIAKIFSGAIVGTAAVTSFPTLSKSKKVIQARGSTKKDRNKSS